MNNLEVNLNEEDEDRRVCKVDRNESVLCSESRGAGIDSSRKASIRNQILHEAEYRRSQKAESSERYGYVYLTTNLINGKMYIGQHKSDHFDESYKGSGILISRAIHPYGWNNFSCIILEWCKSREELNFCESFWVEKFNATQDKRIFYNIAEGGYGHPWKGKSESELSVIKAQIASTLSEYYSIHDNPFKGKHHSDEVRKHISKMITGEGNPNFGKPRDVETRRKISESHKGLKHTEQTKEKLKDIKLGTKASEETKKKISEALLGEKNPFYGKHHTEETIKKIKDHMPDMSGEKNAFYGRHHTSEAIRKISEINTGRKLTDEQLKYRNRKVKCIELNRVFRSATDAARFLFDIPQNVTVKISIIDPIKNSARYAYEGVEIVEAYGYHWIYLDKEVKF